MGVLGTRNVYTLRPPHTATTGRHRPEGNSLLLRLRRLNVTKPISSPRDVLQEANGVASRRVTDRWMRTTTFNQDPSTQRALQSLAKAARAHRDAITRRR